MHMLNVNSADYVDYTLGKAHTCTVVLSKSEKSERRYLAGRIIVEKSHYFSLSLYHKKYSCCFAKLKLSH